MNAESESGSVDVESPAATLEEAPPTSDSVSDTNPEPGPLPEDTPQLEAGGEGAGGSADDQLSPLETSVPVENSSSRGVDDSRVSTYSSYSTLSSQGEECPLHAACCAFDLRAVEEMVRQPDVMIQETDKRGRNAAHLLVKAFGSLHKYDLERPLAKAKLEEIVGVLVKAGLDINTRDYSSQRTPLHIAAAFPDMADTVRVLLMAGSKVNLAEGKKQQTALHVAVDKGYLKNVKALVDGGADPNTADRKGQTPLHLASTGQRHLLICQFLLGCGANANLPDKGGRTPLHVAAKTARPELVRELLHGTGSNEGARVNMPDHSGQTAVHLAASHDITGKVLQEMRRKRADFNLPDFISCETPLHKAVKLNMLENVRVLCQGRANPNLQDIMGDTPLHKAYNSRQLALWQTLIAAGGDMSIRNEDGLSPLSKSLKSRNLTGQCVVDSNTWEQEQ